MVDNDYHVLIQQGTLCFQVFEFYFSKNVGIMEEEASARTWRRHFRRFIRRINIRKQYLLYLSGGLLHAAWAGFI